MFSALLVAAAAAGAPSAFAQTPVPADGDGTVAGQQPGTVAPSGTEGDTPKAKEPKPADKPKLDSPKPAKPAPKPVQPAPTAPGPKPKPAKPAKPAPNPVEAAKPAPESPKPAKPAEKPKKPKPAKPAKPAPKPIVVAAKPPPDSPKPAEQPPKPATSDNAEPGAPVALPTTRAPAAATAQPGTAGRRHSAPRPAKVKLPREPASHAQPGLKTASHATTVRVTAAASVRAAHVRPAGHAFAEPPPPPHPKPMPRSEIASAAETGLDVRQRAALPSLTAESGSDPLTLLLLAIGLVGVVVSGRGLARGPASPRR